ncbi:cache domain-containing sensor histidine kinase [Paenibacillus arenilitoris]|nr:sensor histidine kinase [Paenibacillus arenilitoris]
MRILDLFRKMSLMRQILFLILMMLIILLISFIISNTIAGGIIERKVTVSVDKILQQVMEKMESFYSDMGGISTSLLYGPTIENFLDSDDLTRILMNNEVNSVFANTINLKENIRGIHLYDKDGKLVAGIGAGTGDAVKSPAARIEYSGILSQPNTNVTLTYYSIAFPIYNFKSELLRDYKGTSVFVMNTENFNHILKNAKMTAHSRFLLLDQNNKIMASEGDTRRFDTFDPSVWKNDKRYIYQSAVLPRTGWKLISIIPKNELLQDLDVIQRLNIVTYLIMFGMLCLFLFLFFTRIMKPIKALMDFIKSYPKKGGEHRFNVVVHNEIGMLAVNLNKMLDKIDSLGNEIQLAQRQMYEIEIAKKQAEISAFRNQINPHFLYNTLECIRALALYNKGEEIADISASLSNMFRYSVKGNDFVTIRDEISHVKEYANIIELRFMRRIRVEIEAEEGLLGKKMLKMLLQPIVENAVFHGLEKKRGKGIVQLTVHSLSDNRIRYTVQDNGCGMDERLVQELLQRLRNSDALVPAVKDDMQGIGLPNIYRRIKLFYGDAAEMDIQSQLNSGTMISISIPVHENAEHEVGTNRG